MTAGRDELDASGLKGHARWLERRAFQITHSADLARDLVQETFAAYYEKPPEIEHSLRGWLEGVLRNHYRLWCRTSGRRRRREASLDEPDSGEDAVPDSDLDRARVTQWMHDAIEDIQEPFRSTLRLRYYEDQTAADIARTLKLPQSTVRRRTMIGLQLLRGRLLTRFGGRESLLEATLMRAFALPAGGGGFGETLRRLAQPRPALLLAASGAALSLLLALPARPPSSGPQAARTSDGTTSSSFGRTAGGFTVAPEGSLSPEATDSLAAASQPAGFGTPADDGASFDTGFFGDAPEAPDEAPVSAGMPALTCGSLQTRINRAAAGATIRVPACVFREAIVIDKPLHLQADPGAEIRGSDVFARFTRRGEQWHSVDAVPDIPEIRCRRWEPGENSNGRVCWTFEQVFLDGQRLRPADPGREPRAGEFALSPSRNIILAEPPADRTVEVTTRQTWVTVRANDVSVTGFKMQHALGGPVRGAFAVDYFWDRARVQNNEFLFAGGPAVELQGSDELLAGNRIAFSGGPAVLAMAGDRIRIEGNRFEHNGQGHRRDNGWVTGGIDVIYANVLVTGNQFANNEGAGILCVKCRGSRIHQNRLHNNSAAAMIMLESHDTWITGNDLDHNGLGFEPPHPAIFVTQSSSIHITDNTFAFHHAGIAVNVREGDDLPAGFEPCQVSSFNLIENNLFVSSGQEGVFFTGDPRVHGFGAAPGMLSACPSNRSTANRLWDSSLPAPGRIATGVLPLSSIEKDAVLTRLDRQPR